MSCAPKSGLYCYLHPTLSCCSYYVEEGKNTFSSDSCSSARSITALPTAVRKNLTNLGIAGCDIRPAMIWVHEESSGGFEYHGLIALCFVIGSPSFEFRFEHFFFYYFSWVLLENSRLGCNAFHVILNVCRVAMLGPSSSNSFRGDSIN